MKQKEFMKIAVEISYYPLLADYEPTIINFIERLNFYQQIQVHTNSMSTQIIGSFDEVMSILAKEIKSVFTEEQTSIMVMKILNKV